MGMTEILEQLVKERTEHFVTALDGRYQHFVSDEFLVAYLTAEFMNKVYENNEVIKKNAAYDAAAPLFEGIFEHKLKAGGNGHHMAQEYCGHFEYEKAFDGLSEYLLTRKSKE
jgi:hypothetical protein